MNPITDQVVKMGIDPVTLRPFIAIFWNPNILPTPPKGEWLNKRVRISLKGQFMYQKGQRLNAKGRAIVKEQVINTFTQASPNFTKTGTKIVTPSNHKKIKNSILPCV